MDLDKLKDGITNVSLNYQFFTFNKAKVESYDKYVFPIGKIRSYKSNKAKNLYKPISRIIQLNNFRHE